jgi:ligand-binding sensor domain-containing protein/signal transduction histidine kinase
VRSASTLRTGIAILALQISALAATTGGGYSHRVWRIEDGLPQNRIRALCQTPDGYLWIGTAEGLARFDGMRFTIFDHSNAPALRDDGILALRVARDGALWIGTEGGGLVRYKDGMFRNFGLKEGLTNGFVRAIHEDRSKTLWVGTDRGFFRQTGDRFVRLDDTAEVLLATVTGIGEDEGGRIWVASAAGLLTVADGKLQQVHADCPTVFARTVHESSNGFVWALGSTGAARVRGGCTVPGPALPTVPMRSLVEESDGSLWIGTMGEGLIRFRNGETFSFTASSGLPDNTVNVVFEDREENLWIGCEDGLVRLTTRSGTNIGSREGLQDDNVLTVYADRQDRLWIATTTGQVYRVSGAPNEEAVQRYRLPSPAADLRIRNVFQDSGGALWFGTLAGGLVRQEGKAVTVFTKADGLRSNTIRQILQDRSGALWIALDSGLSRWDGHSFQNFYLQDGLSYPSIRCMITDSKGDLVVGTDAGLNRVHEGRIVADSEFAALRSEKIWAIHLDSNGTLWLGTRGGGLLRFRSGKFLRFTREDGLLTNTIFHILEDRGGKLWMSTSSGVISADRKELDAAAEGSKRSIHVIPYGTAEGMATSQMNGGFQPAGAETTAGDLWFPSVKGAVRISPSRVPVRHAAPVLIERIVVDDQSIPLSTQITVPPGHGRLVIDFTLCELVNPQRFTFQYKLEGLDDNWTPALGGRSAYYTNLPPGRYRFHVMASDSASSSVSEASVALNLRPFFYQTNWLYALLAVTMGTVIWCGFALYARQTRARYALLLTERTRLAREMHDTVIQGCVGVSTLLEAAARFKDLDAAEAEALLDHARLQAKSTLEEARQAVWNLRHPEAGEMSITTLFDLARKLGAEHGLQIETELAGSGSLDPETDRTFLLVAREALRNAVVHAKPQRIAVRVHIEPSEALLEVADDGLGFAAEHEENGQSRHFGIVGMRERVEKLGGAFSIVSNPGAGTRVVARVPLPVLRSNESTVRQSRDGAR